MNLVPVGRYERRLGAGLERLIENALDWEHLPHLHGGSFRAIRLAAADASGWRAEAETADGQALTLDLRLTPDGWITRTSGRGKLFSEIRTRAAALGPDACKVEVDFLVADAPPDQDAAIGAAFRSLYERLYDEDERMMIARAEALARGDAPPPVRDVALTDGSRHAVPIFCPHQKLPLTGEPDADGVIVCPWHGWRYDVRSGRCTPPLRG